MIKTEIEEIKEIFNSIMCLAVEGPDVMRLIEVVDKIAKESEQGYDLCCRHLTSAMHSDGEERCTCDGLPHTKHCPQYKNPD